jgi:hypothetical protein
MRTSRVTRLFWRQLFNADGIDPLLHRRTYAEEMEPGTASEAEATFESRLWIVEGT